MDGDRPVAHLSGLSSLQAADALPLRDPQAQPTTTTTTKPREIELRHKSASLSRRHGSKRQSLLGFDIDVYVRRTLARRQHPRSLNSGNRDVAPFRTGQQHEPDSQMPSTAYEEEARS